MIILCCPVAGVKLKTPPTPFPPTLKFLNMVPTEINIWVNKIITQTTY